MTQVKLVRDIELPGFPRTWKLVRMGDGRVEGAGFTSEAEAREWAPKWGCSIVMVENALLSGVSLGSKKYGGGI